MQEYRPEPFTPVNKDRICINNTKFAIPKPFHIDPAFSAHFRNLHQVFLYITDRCNLECKQCIYKPSISHYITEEIKVGTALDLLATFRRLGATKVSFLGGEPTIYGHKEGGKPLLDLLSGTKLLGYDYIRLVTNGQKTNKFLNKSEFRSIDEIAFSLDGFSPRINDPLRGKGTFLRTVDSIRRALVLNYRVSITCCMQRILLERDTRGILNIESMIRFAEGLGVHQINFHDLFKTGVPMDTWTGDYSSYPHEWVPVYAEISRKVSNNEFLTSVRLPQCFVTKEEFSRNLDYFGYCPAKLGERVMVHPNGTIRICSNLICTSFGVARYHDRRIIWDSSASNELAGHNLNMNTPCANRSRHKAYGDLVPLCFSFKPNQDEYVWNNKLHWDELNMHDGDKHVYG